MRFLYVVEGRNKERICVCIVYNFRIRAAVYGAYFAACSASSTSSSSMTRVASVGTEDRWVDPPILVKAPVFVGLPVRRLENVVDRDVEASLEGPRTVTLEVPVRARDGDLRSIV